MLGKLFKHEFKATGKVLLPLNLALIGVTIIGMIMLGLKVFSFNGMVSTLLGIILHSGNHSIVYCNLYLFDGTILPQHVFQRRIPDPYAPGIHFFGVEYQDFGIGILGIFNDGAFLRFCPCADTYGCQLNR